jgi:hypothetical protein
MWTMRWVVRIYWSSHQFHTWAPRKTRGIALRKRTGHQPSWATRKVVRTMKTSSKARGGGGRGSG